MKKLALFLFLLSLLFIFPRNISAKDYGISTANFVVNINKDGSANVNETRTYNFSGSYHFAYEYINIKNGSTITDFHLFEGNKEYKNFESNVAGTYFVEDQSDKFYVKWFYDAEDESKTFTIKYKINKAVTNQSDISEFYWQLIGKDWDKGVGEVSAKVILPFDAADNKIFGFGHGPLNGKINIVSNHEIDFSATNLPSKTFFEVRALFPKSDTFINANNDTKTLESILNEEKGFAFKTRLTAFIAIGALILLTLYPISKCIYWIRTWWAIGRDDKLPEVNLAGKLHEPPSDTPPALVESFMHWDMHPTGKGVVATIIDLTRRKIIKINETHSRNFLGMANDKYSLELVDPDAEVSLMEARLIDFIFESGDVVSFDTIKNLSKNRPSSTYEFWKHWKEDLEDELKASGFLTQESEDAKKQIDRDFAFMFVYGFFFVFILSFVGALSGYYLLIMIIVLVVTIFSTALLFIIKQFIPKRTEKGNMELASWRAFRSYLKDYSVTKNYPIDSVILWEKYLVYGAALGISLKALSELPVKFNKAIKSSGLYVYGTGHTGGFGSDNFSSSFSSLSQSFAED